MLQFGRETFLCNFATPKTLNLQSIGLCHKIQSPAQFISQSRLWCLFDCEGPQRRHAGYTQTPELLSQGGCNKVAADHSFCRSFLAKLRCAKKCAGVRRLVIIFIFIALLILRQRASALLRPTSKPDSYTRINWDPFIYFFYDLKDCAILVETVFSHHRQLQYIIVNDSQSPNCVF